MPLTFRLPSRRKYDAIPLKGSQLKSGKVIADVTPFDLFHGIKVEFGFIASKTLKPILYILLSPSLVSLIAPISKIPICVSGAITPGVTILFDASTTTSAFKGLVDTSKIVSPSIRISPIKDS